MMPWRSPQWRHEHAQVIARAKHDKMPFPADCPSDANMFTLADFYITRDYEKVPDAVLATVAQPLLFCHDVFRSNHEGCLRHAVEAAALGGFLETFHEEAFGTSIDPYTLRLYQLLYYDVDMRTCGRMWIYHHIIGRISASAKHQSDILWKTIAFENPLRALSLMMGSNQSWEEDMGIVRDAVVRSVLPRLLTSQQEYDKLGAKRQMARDSDVVKILLKPKEERAEDAGTSNDSKTAQVMEALRATLTDNMVCDDDIENYTEIEKVECEKYDDSELKPNKSKRAGRAGSIGVSGEDD